MGRRSRSHRSSRSSDTRTLLAWVALAALYPLVLVAIFSDRFINAQPPLLSDDGVPLHPIMASGDAAEAFPLVDFEIATHTRCASGVYRSWGLDGIARRADGDGLTSSPMAECRRACEFDVRCRAFSLNQARKRCVLSDTAACESNAETSDWVTARKRGASAQALSKAKPLMVEVFALTRGRRCAGHYKEATNLTAQWGARHAYALGEADIADCEGLCSLDSQCITFSFSLASRRCYSFRVRNCKDDVAGWISGDRTRRVIGGDFLSSCSNCTLANQGLLLSCEACRNDAGDAQPSSIETRACAGELQFYNVHGRLACRDALVAQPRRRRPRGQRHQRHNRRRGRGGGGGHS